MIETNDKEPYLVTSHMHILPCQLGYDIGVNSGVGIHLVDGSLQMTDLQVEAFMGCFSWASMVGALSASSVSDRVGRRGTFVVASVSFIIGILWTVCSTSLPSLLIGRAVMGLGVGSGLAIDPLYISEVSPPEFRGQLVTWSETATNAGILLGFLFGFATRHMDDDVAWRLMLSLGMILPAVVIVLVATVMPESPRWLIRAGRSQEAEAVLTKCYAPGSDVPAVVAAIQKECDDEDAAGSTGPGRSWQALLCDSPAYVKRMLIVGVGVAASQQTTGVEAVQYYILFILASSGIQGRDAQFGYLLLIGFIKVIVIVAAGHLFDNPRVGRRALLIGSNVGLFFSLLLLGGNFIAIDEANTSLPNGLLLNATDSGNSQDGPTAGGGSGVLAVFALLVYVTAFSLGMGPGAWLIPSEVFSLEVRARAMSLATFSNRSLAAVAGATFLSLRSALSNAGVCFLFAVLTLVNTAFMYYCVPETRGTSLESMRRYFETSRFPWEHGASPKSKWKGVPDQVQNFDENIQRIGVDTHNPVFAAAELEMQPAEARRTVTTTANGGNQEHSRLSPEA